MQMARIEALAMAISAEHQAFESSSDALHTLNPGLLRAYSGSTVACKKVNGDGYRVFRSFKDGYRALTNNLLAKCSGRTRASGDGEFCLSSTSSLEELCKTFHAIKARAIVEFLQEALDDKAITERTPLSFFVEENHD